MPTIIRCTTCGQMRAQKVRGQCGACYERARRAARGVRYVEPGGVCTRCARPMRRLRRGLCGTCARTQAPRPPACACGQPVHARGLCSACYMRTRRPPRRPPFTCTDCGQRRPHEAKGRCRPCYDRFRKTQQAPPQPARPDPATRRPIPAQTRCPGCKDVPACSRAVLPGTGYCLRCGQLAHQASQAA